MNRLLFRSCLIVLAFVAGTAAAQRAKPAPDPSLSITRAPIERWVSDLSADDMRGRATFSPEIDRAADYLAQQMKALKLKPFGKSFRQSFQVYEAKTKAAGLVLNGELKKPADFYLLSSYERVDWSLRTHPMPVERIRAGESYGLRARAIRAQNRSVIILVDPAHSATFQQRQSAAQASPYWSLDQNSGITRLYVLTPDTFITDYTLKVEQQVAAKPAANVVGIIPGRRSDELVVVSAHYDHIGIRSAVQGDSIANGANDDASGVAGVLALAAYYASQKQKPERTLVFACYTGEEVGMWGSQHFARTVKPEQVVANLNLEMLGKASQWGAGRAYLTGFDRSSLGSLLQQAQPETFYPDPYLSQGLFLRSDNATLARLGVPAHTFSSTPMQPVDPHYHTVDDEAITLDFDHLTRLVRAIAVASRPLVAGQVTPTRVVPQHGE